MSHLFLMSHGTSHVSVIKTWDVPRYFRGITSRQSDQIRACGGVPHENCRKWTKTVPALSSAKAVRVLFTPRAFAMQTVPWELELLFGVFWSVSHDQVAEITPLTQLFRTTLERIYIPWATVARSESWLSFTTWPCHITYQLQRYQAIKYVVLNTKTTRRPKTTVRTMCISS
jgi:hypothetical protein